MFHFVLAGMILLTLIGSCVNLQQSLGDHQRLYSASLIAVSSLSMFILFYFARAFALKAQDRAIRAEERLRFFVLTGKLPDPRLTMGQFLALRFAPDEELLGLAKRAVEERLSNSDIKKAVKNWKADFDRA